MLFYVKNLRTEFKEKYGERLDCIERAIEVLEEIARESKESGNGVRGKFAWNNDFSILYNYVLSYVKQEESSIGYSVYRQMLNKVDEELGRILRERMKILIPKEKKRMLSIVGVE